eukprot:scaffold38950_cov15-Tisochrysis_lutea.AAC.1
MRGRRRRQKETRPCDESLASKLSCHAMQRVTTINNSRHALHFWGASGVVLLSAWKGYKGYKGLLSAWKWKEEPG